MLIKDLVFIREGSTVNVHDTQILAQRFCPYRVALQGEIGSLVCYKVWGCYRMNERGMRFSNRFSKWMPSFWLESKCEIWRLSIMTC